MSTGVVFCLTDEEFERVLYGWRRPLPMLQEPREAINPFTGEAFLTRLPDDRPRAQVGAIRAPSFSNCTSEIVDGLGPEAVEVLGAAMGLWHDGDEVERVSAQELGGPVDPGCSIYELPPELVSALARIRETDAASLAGEWHARLRLTLDVWPRVASLDDYSVWLRRLAIVAQVATKSAASAYLAVSA